MPQRLSGKQLTNLRKVFTKATLRRQAMGVATNTAAQEGAGDGKALAIKKGQPKKWLGSTQTTIHCMEMQKNSLKLDSCIQVLNTQTHYIQAHEPVNHMPKTSWASSILPQDHYKPWLVINWRQAGVPHQVKCPVEGKSQITTEVLCPKEQ